MIKKFETFISEKNMGGIELHYYCFDVDDNLLHLDTVIHMDKLVGNEWIPVDVSTADFAIFRNDKENYRLRNGNPDESFSEFRDTGPRGKMAFLIDVKKAIRGGSFGPAWDNFIKCLTEGAIFAIITARGHEPETIRKAIEYIIDQVLDENEQMLLYNNCLKHSYIFASDTEFDRIPKGKLSQTSLIRSYLSQCDFYGVSSQSFKKEFGEGSASNPEHAKELALEKFIEKCNFYGRNVGAKSVSVGFSDDDPKNVEHVRIMFKEKSALSHDFDHELKLSLYKTTDRSKKGGEVSKFRSGEEIKEATDSIQAPGMASSVMSFTQYNNLASRLFPSNTKDNDPVANTHRLATDFIHNKSKEWTSKLRRPRGGTKKKKKNETSKKI
jgi:hypothetical protein